MRWSRLRVFDRLLVALSQEGPKPQRIMIDAKKGCSKARLAVGGSGSPYTRLDGLCDEPRPGAPPKIGDEAIAETIRLTLETLFAALNPRPTACCWWKKGAPDHAIGRA